MVLNSFFRKEVKGLGGGRLIGKHGTGEFKDHLSGSGR
jgi:hypothetical protein